LTPRTDEASTPDPVGGFDLNGEATPIASLIKETWASRELIRTLARKEFFVRYRRASFGLAWAVALPLLQAVILSYVISRFARFSTIDHYGVYVFAGTLTFSFFSTALTSGATSIVDGSAMSTKIYFPRAVFPLVAVGSGVYGFALSCVLLVVMALVVGVDPHPRLLLIVPAGLLVVALTVAGSLVLSALHVYFRDIRYVVQAVLLPLFYLTPVFYPLSAAGDAAGWIKVNPVTGIVELVHAATVGAEPGWTSALFWSAGWLVVLLAVGCLLHRRYDRVFGDLL
jgi:ABC-type polysaccharide/polyol phosphate export permease